MKYRVEWAPVAYQDLAESVSYIATHDNLGAAERLAARVLARVEPLADRPGRCRIVPELRAAGTREYRELLPTPYRIFLRVTERTVAVVGVLDGRRDLEELLIERYLEG